MGERVNLDGNHYSVADMIVGIGITTLTTELLEHYRFPNPTEARIFTPAFAVGLATGLGAVILASHVRGGFRQRLAQGRSESDRSP